MGELKGPDSGRYFVMNDQGIRFPHRTSLTFGEVEYMSCVAFGDGTFGLLYVNQNSYDLNMQLVDEEGFRLGGPVFVNAMRSFNYPPPYAVPAPGSDYKAEIIFEDYTGFDQIYHMSITKGRLDMKLSDDSEVMQVFNHGAFAADVTLAALAAQGSI